MMPDVPWNVTDEPAEGLQAPGPTNWQAPQKESHDVDISYTNDSICDIKTKMMTDETN